MTIGSDPNRVGATVSTEDAPTLAELDATGFPPGTIVYVTSLASKFTLTVSTASLVANSVVAVAGIDGYRWIINQGGAASIPLSELAAQADQTIVGNVSGASASPVALTQAQAKTFIGVATPSTAGLMSAAQAAAMLNVGVGVADFTYITDVNALVVAAAQLTPVVAGYTFVPTRLPITNIAVTGAATANMTFSVGTNSPSYTNAVASTGSLITSAFINTGLGGTVYAAPNAALIGSAIPLFANITVAPTGVTALTLRFQVQGYWMPTTF